MISSSTTSAGPCAPSGYGTGSAATCVGATTPACCAEARATHVAIANTVANPAITRCALLPPMTTHLQGSVARSAGEQPEGSIALRTLTRDSPHAVYFK